MASGQNTKGYRSQAGRGQSSFTLVSDSTEETAAVNDATVATVSKQNVYPGFQSDATACS